MWTSAHITRNLNRAINYIVGQFYLEKCWKPLAKLQKEATYNLTGTEIYSVYTIIGSSTDYYGFINAQMKDILIKEVTIEEYNRINNAGEYVPTSADPYLCFYDYDSTVGHGALPKIRIRPYASTDPLYFRYLRNPVDLTTGGTIPDLYDYCGEAIVLWSAKTLWANDRNSEQFKLLDFRFNDEMKKLLSKFSEPFYDDVRYQPVT